MLKNIAATIAGILSAIAVVALVQMAGHTIYPQPPGIDKTNPETIANFVDTLPLGALLFVVAGWVLSPFLGAITATVLSGKHSIIPGLAVGLAILLATVANLYAIPHPLWMSVTGIIAPLPAAWLGAKLLQT